MMRRNRTLVRVGFALLALVLVAALVLPMAGVAFGAPASSAAGAGGATTTPDAAASSTAGTADGAEPADVTGPVVLLGTAGLRWEDLSAVGTPALWTLAEGGSIANLVVRSVRSSSCPADGWLAVSAGRRAADLPTGQFGTCRRLAEVRDAGVVPGWEEYLQAASEASYDATPGLLGEILAEAGTPAVAVGPGAAIALATPSGTVAGEVLSAPSDDAALAARVSEAVDGAELVVVDLGAIRDPGRPLVAVADPRPTPAPTEEVSEDAGEEKNPLMDPDRATQVLALDARVAAVLDALGDAGSPTVLLASLADSGRVPLMQVIAADGPPYEEGLLSSTSTRQPGIVQSTDLTPTLLSLLGLDAPAGLVGSPMTTEPGSTAATGRIRTLQDENAHAVAIRPLVAPFFSALVAVNLLLYAAVSVGFNRRILDRVSARLERRGSAGGLTRLLRNRQPAAALRPLRAVAVTVAAIPVASYLANLLPWWRAGSPGLVVFTATACIAALIAGAALAPPWRDRLMVPVGIVTGVTVLTLALDVLTGARLQLSALMGVQPQVGGRFYGFNNSSFSLWLAASILLATCLAEPLVRRGRRRAAAAVVAALGIVVVGLDGAPTIGADFGGPPALIPGFALLTLLTLGIRLTWRRVVAVLAATVVVAVSFSVVDWLRPPAERTHLGRFVETVLDGGLFSVVGRKLAQNLDNLFGSTLTFMAAGGIAVVILVLLQPLRRAARGEDPGAYGWLAEGSSLSRLGADAVMLRPGLIALAVSLGIGFAVNDSGVVIPAIGVSVAVPLLISVLATWLLGIRRGPAPASPRAPDPLRPARR
ncbi:hypothetical protein [Georgenia faecalis]|uniref:Uncharacterized protein n=1 Tax=Georgenia faecalis TaxID=2483799 RepID=A0ABV9D6U0_9MICO|nr:hypothetical protein [Georgenia faecalis]